MPFFSRNSNSRSVPKQSGTDFQHLIQPQNTYKRFRISLSSCLLCRSRHHDTTPQLPGIDIIPPGIPHDGREQNGSAVDSVPATPHRDPSRPASMRIEGHNPLSNITEPVAVSVATQFQDAGSFNISGSPQFTNIGRVNNNFYGGTHGLENLKESVSFPALHDSFEQDPDRRCHPGTRKTVLMQLRDWIDNPNPTDRIFWLYGPAGAGKSAIAQTIAHGCNQGDIAATFFFYRSDAARNDGNQLFTTIAWQIAFSIPATKDHIVDVLDKIPHLPTKGVEAQFEKLIAYPLQPINDLDSQMSQSAPVVIIDGVDECSSEQLQRRILTVIGDAVKDCHVPLRFLICSRPEALIEETLNRFKDFTLRIDLATLDDSNRDIEKYLVDNFSDIASKQGLDASWPGQETIEEIVFKSSGNFILASTLIRYIGDEDHSAVTQLDIVRKLKPQGAMSPFASLDELYLEILNRQLDKEFLKTFLALLVARTSINQEELHNDDAMLMNISEKELHIKLRRMRSLLKFKPFIEVYHKSFLDFLQDSSRSGQYHVSETGGLKRYLELIVDSIVRHIFVIKQPNFDQETCSSPKLMSIMCGYPPKIDLPVEDWQEALRPLLVLRDKLLNTLTPHMCCVVQVMRDLQMQLVILQRNSHTIATQIPESIKSETVTECSQAVSTENVFEKDLDSCLSALLSFHPKSDFVVGVDAGIVDRISCLLTFNYLEVIARVQSVSNAQMLIDLIDLMTNNECFLNQCGRDAARKAVFLASEIFKRIPLLPRFLLNGSVQCSEGSFSAELLLQSLFISRILDHSYIVPVSWIYYQEGKYRFDCCNVNEQNNESVHEWLERSNPDLVTRIRVVLGIARTVRYIHSMDIGLHRYAIQSKYFVLDLNLRVRFLFIGSFGWSVKEASIYGPERRQFLACTYEDNISAFGDLFNSVCFHDDNEIPPNRLVEDARQLIGRCHAEDPMNQLTLADVVKEIETWNLI